MEIEETLYEVCDEGDRWNNTLRRLFVEELELLSIPTDKVVFSWKGRKCSRALRLLVDDIIGCGNNEFFTLTDTTCRQFDVRPEVLPKFEFAGVSVEKIDYGYLANQVSYSMTLGELSLDAKHEEFISLQNKLT